MLSKAPGPRSEAGKQRSRYNALRHGLTAETVIAALEHKDDYQAFAATIAADYQPRSAVETELVSRLASLLWRLRRSTRIETGLFQIQAELVQDDGGGSSKRRTVPVPEWHDEIDAPKTAYSLALAKPKPAKPPKRWRIASCKSAVSDTSVLTTSAATRPRFGDRRRRLCSCCNQQPPPSRDAV